MLMTIEDLSIYLKVSKETLYKLVQKGEVPASKIGNQWRFQKSKIDLWLDNLAENSHSQQSKSTTKQEKSA